MSAERINQANGRLRAAKIGATIYQVGNRLYLRATLPPKPTSTKQYPHQQRLSLKIPASNAGISAAEREARKIGALLACGQFDWADYSEEVQRFPATATWIAKFEREFRGNVTAVTWRTEYESVFKQLPDRPLTEELLREVILTQTKANTKQRRRFCLTLGKLAKFAGLNTDFSPLQGSYSARCVDPRSLPTDEAIAHYFWTISDPGWRWLYGMLATYGLRGHEVFHLDTVDFEAGHCENVVVLEGKTGRRLIWPFFPEWVETFQLRKKVLPAVTAKDHAAYTNKVSKFFYRSDIPFRALDLRHRWAIRTIEFGLPDSLAAKQMGHSLAVHHGTYHHWIDESVHRRAFQAILSNPRRPQPPLVDLA